jgi:hypothetical protein
VDLAEAGGFGCKQPVEAVVEPAIVKYRDRRRFCAAAC